MTIQEYKEKIIHTIEQMEMEHDMKVKELRVETKAYDMAFGVIHMQRTFEMTVE